LTALAPISKYFQNNSNIFIKSLKFPKSLPLQNLDTGNWVLDGLRKYLKIFSKSPKVSLNRVVTGSDAIVRTGLVVCSQRFFGK
jgi:hypothetical protein